MFIPLSPTPPLRQQAPAEPPPPDLGVRFAGLSSRGVPPLDYAPGLQTPEDHGRSSLEVRPAEGVALLFRAAVAAVVGPAVEAATAAAKARIERVRRAFAADGVYVQWRAAAERLAELKAAAKRVTELAPEAALAKARRLMAEGKSPAPAEAEHAAATAEADNFRRRLAAATDLEQTARLNARDVLATRLRAERAAIEAEHRAEALRLAGEITAGVGARLEALLVANAMAGRASANANLAARWGGVGADGLAGSPELP